jgi:protein-S-isoprenylcysteine O-methyltransferase Ste14
MWAAATAFVDVERPRGDPDIANFFIPLALILTTPVAVFDQARLLASALPGSVIWVGLLISFIAILLGLASRIYLGRSYSPSPHRLTEDRLIQHGPYQWIRHPLYSAALLWITGWPLILGSLLSVALALLFVLPVLLKRIQTEEAEMLQEFGSEYEHYCRTTYRLIPYVY